MCFTIAIHLTRQEIENRFNARMDPHADYQPSYYLSAFAMPEVPVISNRDKKTVQLFRWGLIPSWIKDEESADSIRKKTFNARVESVADKPSYRNAIRGKRCLVISRGFFEWQIRGKEKIPFFIYLKGEEPFAFAGIYDNWINPGTGEIVNTFSIITTDANPLMAEIHNSKKRMPVILARETEKIWLEEDVPLPKVLNILRPYSKDNMQAHTISKLISRPGVEKNVPELIQPYHYEDTKLL